MFGPIRLVYRGLCAIKSYLAKKLRFTGSNTSFDTGTKHLQLATKDLPFYKLYLIDVVLFMTTILLVVLFLICTIRFVLRQRKKNLKEIEIPMLLAISYSL